MEQEYFKRVTQLEVRVSQLETMLQTLLIRQGINPAEIRPQEPPEIKAIHEALRAGKKIEAIKIYRYLYDVGLKEAKDAIDAMYVNPI